MSKKIKEPVDVLYDKAVVIVLREDKYSAQSLQRQLSIGYCRAARIIEQMKASNVRPLSLMTTSEKTIQSSILKWLNAQPKTWAVKFPGVLQRGVPDVLCCMNGRFFAFEVKAVGGKATPVQLAVIKQINNAKGEAFVVWSLDEVKMWYNAYKD